MSHIPIAFIALVLLLSGMPSGIATQWMPTSSAELESAELVFPVAEPCTCDVDHPCPVRADPNPFSVWTCFTLCVPRDGSYLIEIQDAIGRPLRTLTSGFYKRGRYHLYWNGCTAEGHEVNAGSYSCVVYLDDSNIVNTGMVMRE